jgi:hypothetical protein
LCCCWGTEELVEYGPLYISSVKSGLCHSHALQYFSVCRIDLD